MPSKIDEKGKPHNLCSYGRNKFAPGPCVAIFRVREQISKIGTSFQVNRGVYSSVCYAPAISGKNAVIKSYVQIFSFGVWPLPLHLLSLSGIPLMPNITTRIAAKPHERTLSNIYLLSLRSACVAATARRIHKIEYQSE